MLHHSRVKPRAVDWVAPLAILLAIVALALWGFVDIVLRLFTWVLA